MSFNLIESVKSVLSGDMTNKIAGILGESAANIQQALQGIIPSVLTGILLKADSGDIHETLNLATDAARIDIPFNLKSLATGNGNSKGMDFLKSLFGEKTTALSDAIAEYSGVSKQSASAILNITAPAALGVLGKHILDSNMNASGLRSFLNSQKKKVLNAMPAGILLDGIMGSDDISGIAEKIAVSEHPPGEERKKYKWVLPLAIILAAGGGIWYFMYRQPVPETQQQPVTDTVATVKDSVSAQPVPENTASVKLPDGTILNAKKGGLEDQLLTFFNDPSGKPSRRFQFNFDQLNFENESSVITNESMVQIQNIASILKAFPRAKIKIGGFNEKGGDSAANRILSESRATAVATAIKAAGVNAKQIVGVEGFGSEFAKYTGDAADSLREKDKRISISVRNK